MGILAAIVLFKHQRNPLLLAAYCYSWNFFPTFFISKKRWENKKNVKTRFCFFKRKKNVFTSMARSMTGYRHDNVVYLFACPSVCL